MASQVSELNVIRRSLYELESQHSKARQLYEDELSRLRIELAAAQPPPTRPLGIQGLPSASGSQSLSSDALIASASASSRHEAKSSVDGDDRRRPREYNGNNSREREREVDRAQDGRDPKRLKTKSGVCFFFLRTRRILNNIISFKANIRRPCHRRLPRNCRPHIHSMHPAPTLPMATTRPIRRVHFPPSTSHLQLRNSRCNLFLRSIGKKDPTGLRCLIPN